jgi:hypothetical protein
MLSAFWFARAALAGAASDGRLAKGLKPREFNPFRLASPIPTGFRGDATRSRIPDARRAIGSGRAA